MENRNIIQRSSTSSQGRSDPRQCWVCFGTGDDDHETNRDWVSPCKCRGSTRWVHQDCVQRWVDEKQKEDLSIIPHCPQCHTHYIIVYDDVGYFLQLLNRLDRTSNHISIFLAAGVVGSTLYWSGISYGAITIIQMFGEREAITMMENTDPFILLLLLPSIPLILIVAKTINWEKTSVVFVQRFIPRIPLLRTIMPSYLFEPIVSSSVGTIQFNAVFNPMSTLSTAILLPTTGSIVGNVLFNNTSYSYLQKALLGGLVYITVKGIFRMYRRHSNVKNEGTRKVINYPEFGTGENY